MIDFIKDPNSWLSIITAIVAIMALIISIWQMNLSNRHQLFDRRVDKYILIKELLSLYSRNRMALIGYNDSLFVVDLLFNWLVNCSTLESMAPVMSDPLDTEKKKVFLTKCEMLEHAAVEIKLIWTNKEAELFSEFVNQYVKLLKSLHMQQIYLNDLQTENELKISNNQGAMDGEVAEKRIREFAEKVGIYSTISALEKTYNMIIETNAESRLVKSIKL